MRAPSPLQTGTPIRAVLFDLDGTLVDTAPDLALALNRLREEEGLPPLPFEAIRSRVSHGGTALIRLGFPHPPDSPEFQALRRRFLQLYERNLTVHTRLFPGMETVLGTLERQGIGWGVVTNKPGWLTNPLMDQLGLSERAACIVCGDTLPESKPHPAPILYACQRMMREPAECIYVGDAQRDVEAGRAAGTRTLIALFGYLGAADHPQEWGADEMVATPEAILSHLDLSLSVPAPLTE